LHNIPGSFVVSSFVSKPFELDPVSRSITWVGPGLRGDGRTIFSSAILASGQEVSVGACVKLIAERKVSNTSFCVTTLE
jgi:hypothetical protein